MGDHRKPTAKLKLHGTYRKDMNGDRSKEPQPSGLPRKPDCLDADASAHWDKVAPQLAGCGVGKEIDEHALQQMCEMWSLYRASLAVARLDPTDKVARTAVVGYGSLWLGIASRFGLTPSDRAKISSDVPGDKSSKAKKFFG